MKEILIINESDEDEVVAFFKNPFLRRAAKTCQLSDDMFR